MINIVLYEPRIPGNTGNIMRTCVATNTKLHLIKPLGFSIDENSLKRSGVNYIDKLDMTVYENFEEFKEKNEGTYYYFTRYATRNHTSFDYSNLDENIYLVFGSEDTGIPKEILEDSLDTCARIPMSENVRALNLSNSAAIMVYEVLRQQDYRDLLNYDPHKGIDYLTKKD